MFGHTKKDNNFPSSARTPFASRPAITIMPLFYNYSTFMSPLHCYDVKIESKSIVHYNVDEHTLLVKERVESCQVVQTFMKT